MSHDILHVTHICFSSILEDLGFKNLLYKAFSAVFSTLDL